MKYLLYCFVLLVIITLSACAQDTPDTAGSTDTRGSQSASPAQSASRSPAASLEDRGGLDETAVKREIMAVMKASEAGWNEGNIEQYMQCYVKSDSMRFGANGSVTHGWNNVFERYKARYTTKAIMGTLTFHDMDITVISKDTALVFGRWKLDRDNEHPSGLYTLLFRKTPDGWRIVHDHTSSAQE